MLLHTAQETLLLLLLGVSSNVFAYGMDRSIEQLVAMRARAAQEAGGFLPSYLLWSGSALVLCALSAACAQHISSAAVGSGIPQMKCVLAGGARIDHYLSARTLAAKVLSLVLAIGGGLAVGKEGPYVHISTCVAQQLCRLPLFRRLNETEALRRQMLAISRHSNSREETAAAAEPGRCTSGGHSDWIALDTRRRCDVA